MSASGRLAGILVIPSLGVTEPVLQGLDDGVINVAVGHDPSSPWPGQPGESLLEAHDVTYFSSIDQLRPGDQVQWLSGCRKTTFRVISSDISSPGRAIYPPASGLGLALVTCSPTDALWWTPNRYVVETAFASSVPYTGQFSLPVIPNGGLQVPAPASLAAEGLTLQTNYSLLGSLTVAGKPDPIWRQSPEPLDVDALAFESYFGAQKAIAAGNRMWWKAIAAPSVPMPGPWSTAAPVSVVVTVNGTHVAFVTLSSSLVTMRLVVRHEKLLIASVVTR